MTHSVSVSLSYFIVFIGIVVSFIGE